MGTCMVCNRGSCGELSIKTLPCVMYLVLYQHPTTCSCLLIPGTFTSFFLHKVRITLKTFWKEFLESVQDFQNFRKLIPLKISSYTILTSPLYFHTTIRHTNKMIGWLSVATCSWLSVALRCVCVCMCACACACACAHVCVATYTL